MVTRSRPGAALVAVLTALTLLPASAFALASSASASPHARVAITRHLTAKQVAAREVAAAPVPRLVWKQCKDLTKDKRVTCASVKVPLDYKHPRGATTTIAVAKVAAATKNLHGSLFVNPGGPGGPGRFFALEAGRLLGERVDRYFDVIGVDPRGVSGSGATVCRGGTAGSPFPPFGYPIGKDQVRQQITADDNLRLLCKRGASALVDHASTADDAKDMDLVRRALHESKLTYYGISYGTYLGATYAALFPSHIRAMVVDGVLDPVAWSTGDTDKPVTVPFTTRVKSGEGSYETLTSAFTECDRVGHRHCSLAPDSKSKFLRIYDKARAGTLELDGSRVAPQDIIGFALSSLYRAGDIKSFFHFLASVTRTLDAPAAGRVGSANEQRAVRLLHHLQRVRLARADAGLYSWLPARASTAPSRTVHGTADVVFQAVGCGDSRNPTGEQAWERAAKQTDLQSPYFGRLWTWQSGVCAKGGINTQKDAFFGPWATHTSYPLLVVGNVHDPATPVSGARRVNSLFAKSVLLLYNGWGHGALGTGACIRTKVADYLTQRVLPPDGVVCQPARELFNAK